MLLERRLISILFVFGLVSTSYAQSVRKINNPNDWDFQLMDSALYHTKQVPNPSLKITLKGRRGMMKGKPCIAVLGNSKLSQGTVLYPNVSKRQDRWGYQALLKKKVYVGKDGQFFFRLKWRKDEPAYIYFQSTQSQPILSETIYIPVKK